MPLLLYENWSKNTVIPAQAGIQTVVYLEIGWTGFQPALERRSDYSVTIVNAIEYARTTGG
ncbi:MAG: hypothetical protein WCL29_02270 [Pseudomonadota bacterium]